MQVLTFALVIFAVVGLQACPQIYTRSQWGARSPRDVVALRTPVPYVVIHHTASTTCYNFATCSRLVRQFQRQHMAKSPPWSDIGYNFLIGQDGKVYEGRGWNGVGAHAPNYNSKSIGISFIGSFTRTKPVKAALNAGKALIECGVRLGYIQRNYKLVGHRQVTSTACPGDAFFSEIKTWPRWVSTVGSSGARRRTRRSRRSPRATADGQV